MFALSLSTSEALPAPKSECQLSVAIKDVFPFAPRYDYCYKMQVWASPCGDVYKGVMSIYMEYIHSIHPDAYYTDILPTTGKNSNSS
jgi:hypothetical protein